MGVGVTLVGLLIFYILIRPAVSALDGAVNDVARDTVSSRSKTGDVFFHTADAGQMGFLVYIYFALSGGSALFGTALIIRSAVTSASGVPKASKQPKETVLQFYKNLVRDESNLDVGRDGHLAALKAFVCLLGCARSDIRGLEGLFAHWATTNCRISETANSLAKGDKNVTAFLRATVRTVKVKIDTITLTEVSETAMNYSVVLKVCLACKNADKFIDIGMHSYTVLGQLVLVGTRWYLTDGCWLGKLNEINTTGDAALA